MSIQSVLDGILPGAASAIADIRGLGFDGEEKHWKMGRVFVLIFAIALIGRFFGYPGVNDYAKGTS